MKMKMWKMDESAPESIKQRANYLEENYYVPGELEYYGFSPIDDALCFVYSEGACVVSKVGPALLDIDGEFFEGKPEVEPITDNGDMVLVKVCATL